MKNINTIILGGGPSGLCCSHYLKEAGIENLIIEKNKILHTWRNERWDSFTLVTPNWMTRIPGMEDLIPKDNEFMTKDEINSVLSKFVEKLDPNVLEDTLTTSISREGDDYIVKTTNGDFKAKNVIVAIGLFNNPYIPNCTEKLPENILQLNAVNYKNPDQLNEGNAIVVGSGRSGVQIAYEIKKDTNKKVWLSIGSVKPIPTIHKQTNGVFWLNRLSGFTDHEEIIHYNEDDTVNNNILSKIYQNLGLCCDEGVELIGRMNECNDGKLKLATNLAENIESGNEYLKEMLRLIDTHIDGYKIEVPNYSLDFKIPNLDLSKLEQIEYLDLEENNITNVIWCTGFRPDYDFVKFDIFNEFGYPKHDRGVTEKSGLYFTGQELDPGFGGKSSFGIGLFAISNDAKHVVEDIIKKAK